MMSMHNGTDSINSVNMMLRDQVVQIRHATQTAQCSDTYLLHTSPRSPMLTSILVARSIEPAAARLPTYTRAHLHLYLLPDPHETFDRIRVQDGLDAARCVEGVVQRLHEQGLADRYRFDCKYWPLHPDSIELPRERCQQPTTWVFESVSDTVE